MHSPHKHHRHEPMDRVTGALAAGSLICLMILGGCGPQSGTPVQSVLSLPPSNASAIAYQVRTGRAVPERAAAATPVDVKHQAVDSPAKTGARTAQPA
ncbi:MAG: hypothetical protein KF891_09365 [Rhizobacter sp.]|nr:hypothetical protein [Rhizobacter sp.]